MLVANFIRANPYREHHEKNFNDKIFFYEPVNKYYDLLWLKRSAFLLLNQDGRRELIDQAVIQSALQATSLASAAAGDKPAELEELSEAQLQFETKVHRYMLEQLASPNAKAIVPSSSDAFMRSLSAPA